MDEQFNWIFIIFTGAIFLMFLIGFGVKYVGLKQTEENAEISRGVDLIINGLGELTQYKNLTMDIPFKLSFECDKFYVNDDVAMSLDGKVVFAPEEIEGNSIFAWSKEWRFPFDAGNFVYLIDKDEKYVLHSDPYGLKELVPAALRDNFDGNEGVHVFFNGGNVNYERVVVIGDSTVSFYEDGKLTGDSKHYGVPFILGAIFSNGFEQYNCNYERALERMENLRKIYFNKAGLLFNNCNYNVIKGYLIEDLTNNNVDLISFENDRLSSCEVLY